MNNFKQASREALRFNTAQGPLSVEQLWTAKESTLIALEEKLTEEVESFGKGTRRKPIKNAAKATAELQLSIVTEILDTLIEEKELAAQKLKNKAINDRIDAELFRRQELKLTTLSEEELLQMKV